MKEFIPVKLAANSTSIFASGGKRKLEVYRNAIEFTIYAVETVRDEMPSIHSLLNGSVGTY